MSEKQIEIHELDSLYEQAITLDSRFFIRVQHYERLKSGDHYHQRVASAIRDTTLYKSTNRLNKLRLVQNHISRFFSVWENALHELATDVEVLPNTPEEEKDKKAAELNRSVKAHIIEEIDWYSIQSQLESDFLRGEAIVRIQNDSNSGPLVNDEVRPAVDAQGYQMIDEMGQPLFIQTQVPAGMMGIERLESENVFRDPSGRTWKKCRWIGYRSLIPEDKFKALVKSLVPEDKRLDIINAASKDEEDIKIVKGHEARVQASDNLGSVLIKEYYFRPCVMYPDGQYFLTVKGHIVFQTEFPAGVFPIEVVNFDEQAGSPRGESRLKHLSPIQLEINRATSQEAEHQVTLGDDKLVVFGGGKVAEMKKYSGTRLFKVNGSKAPTVIPGRSGAQFMPFIERQIMTFNQIADIPEINEDKLMTLDAMTIFFLSAKQKKRYAKYGSKFERFLIRIWKKTLKIHKEVVHPSALIPILGANEHINIDEYKQTEDLCFQIKLKPRTDDPESIIAQNQTMTQFMQYAGGLLDEIDVGQMAMNMPFLKSTDLNLKGVNKAKRAQNMILKLDKGMDMPVSEADDPDYMLQRLDTRMSEPSYDNVTYRHADGRHIPTEIIQQLYQMKREQYLQILAQRAQAEADKQNGHIPLTGSVVSTQLYTTEPNSEGEVKPERVYFPHDSLVWLKDYMARVGTMQASIAAHSSQSQEDLNRALSNVNSISNQVPINGGGSQF